MLTDNILDLIGNTPLIRLKGENVFTKAEFLNPGGSIKDRVALSMLEGAERDGKLKDDSIIVEPTSGNTGIGIALVGRLKGYKVRIVMPENMSEERKKLIRGLGAELVLTPAGDGIEGAVRLVEKMKAEDKLEEDRFESTLLRLDWIKVKHHLELLVNDMHLYGRDTELATRCIHTITGIMEANFPELNKPWEKDTK